MEITIELEKGNSSLYKIDKELLNGLYITEDIHKITDNCNNLGIQINTTIGSNMHSKTSKRGDSCILTLKHDELSLKQYLIAKDLDLEEVEQASPSIISTDLKKIVIELYKLTDFS